MSRGECRTSRIAEREFKIVAVKVELTPEENQHRIARIARWLLQVSADLEDRNPQVTSFLDEDPLDVIGVPTGCKPTPRRGP